MPGAIIPEALTQTIGAPTRESRAYVSFTQTENFGTEVFNGTERTTRDVTVSGVTLVFDMAAGDALMKSMILQPDGRPWEDIRRFNIYADTVVVKSQLRLPGTQVLVQARELRFEDQGAIDTTPIDLGVPNDPPVLELGVPVRGAKGSTGEPAGNVTLNVGNVVTAGGAASDERIMVSSAAFRQTWRLPAGAGGVRLKVSQATKGRDGFIADQQFRITLLADERLGPKRSYIFGLRGDQGTPGTAWISHTQSANPLAIAPRPGSGGNQPIPETEAANRKFAWPATGPLSVWIYFNDGYAALGTGERSLEQKLVEWRDPAPTATRTMYMVQLAHGCMSVRDAQLAVTDLRVVPARFVLQGGTGQPGGPGGFKAAGAATEAAPSRDLAPVTLDEVKQRIAKAVAKEEASAPDKVVFREFDQDTLADEFKANRVVYAQFNTMSIMDVPNRSNRFAPGFILPSGGKKVRPQNGRDAYTAGTPGNGGPGGVLTSSTAIEAALATFDGGAGGLSAATAGEKAGTPRDAVWITNCLLNVFVRGKDAQGNALVDARFEHPNIAHAGRAPREKYVGKAIEDVPAADGKSAPEERGSRGAAGKLVVSAKPQGAWLHPLNVMPVIEYARDAFQAGDRAGATETLVALRRSMTTPPAPAPIAAELATIDTLLSRLTQGLDAFGHPPGWVPRLGIAATVPIFKKVVTSAYEVIYAAYRLQWAYEKKLDAQRLLGNAVETLNKQTDQAKADILAAQAALPRLKQELEGIKTEIDLLQQKFASFRNELIEEAKKNVESQKAEIAFFKGIFKLMSAACYVFPVGQPYLGQLGGNLAELVSTAKDDDQDVLKIAASYTKATTEFFGDDKNQTKLIGDLTKNEQGTLTQIQTELGELTKSETQIKANQDLLNKDIENLIAAKKADLAPALTQAMNRKASFERLQAYRELDTDEKRAAFIRGRKLDIAISEVEGRIAAIDKDPKVAPQEKQAMNDLKRDLSALGTRQKGLNDLKTETERRLADRKQSVENALGIAKNVGIGVGKGIEAIQTLRMDTTATQAEIERELQKLAEGKYRKEWTERTQQLARELDLLNRKKEAFIGRIDQYQRSIGVNAEAMHANLRKVDGMSQAALNLSGSLDPLVARFAADLSRRARQGVLEWRNIFARAWEYQFAAPISAEVYNLQEVENKLQSFISTDAEGKKTELKAEDFETLGKLTMAPLREHAKAMLASYASDRPEVQVNTYDIRAVELLGADGIERLNRTVIPAAEIARLKKNHNFSDGDIAAFNRRKLTLEQIKTLDKLDVDWDYESIVFDFPSRGYGRRDWEFFRIVSLGLDDFNVEWLAAPRNAKDEIQGNLELELTHSGTSIVRSQGKYYAFRDQSPDMAIVWRFIYRQTGDKSEIKPPEVPTWDTKVLAQLGLDEKDATEFAAFAQYRPGGMSPITVQRRRVGRSTVALIKDFTVKLTFERSSKA